MIIPQNIQQNSDSTMGKTCPLHQALPSLGAQFGFYLFTLFIFVSLGPYPRHMEVPKPGVESEL